MNQPQGAMTDLDAEWIELMMTARKLGISKEEIRDFLKQSTPRPDRLLTGAKPLSMQWIAE